MVKMIKQPKRKVSFPTPRVAPTNPTTRYSMRIYTNPKSPIDRLYRSLEQMEKWRTYYKNRGIKTRAI